MPFLAVRRRAPLFGRDMCVGDRGSRQLCEQQREILLCTTRRNGDMFLAVSLERIDRFEQCRIECGVFAHALVLVVLAAFNEQFRMIDATIDRP